MVAALLTLDKRIQEVPFIKSAARTIIPAFDWFVTIKSAPIIISIFGFGWFQCIFITDESLYLSGFSGFIAVVTLALCSIPVYLAFAYSSLGLKDSGKTIRFGFYAFSFTAAIGMIFLLLIVQPLSAWLEESSFPKPGRLAFLYIFELIGWSYKNMFNPEAGFFKSAVAFTFSAGLCEEFVKLLPVFFSLHAWSISGISIPNKCDIPSALKTVSVKPGIILFIGFMSGIGFGVCEAIVFYSPWSQAPLLSLNFLRWFSLVPMHAFWALIDSTILIWAWPRFYNSKSGFGQIIGLLLIVLAASILHGFYNSASARVQTLAIFLQLAAVVLAIFMVKTVLKESVVETIHNETSQIFKFPFQVKTSNFYPIWFLISLLLVSIVYGLSEPIVEEGGYRTTDDGWYMRSRESRPSTVPTYQTPSVFPCPACGGRGFGYVPLPAGMRHQAPMVQVCFSCGGSGIVRR
jgi:hypothetical protein